MRLETVLKSLMAGGLSGAVAKTVIAPFDRVKILFQVNPSKKFSMRAALRVLKFSLYIWESNIVEIGGLLNIFAGGCPCTLAR